MEQSQNASQKNLHITPGKKLCRTCQIKVSHYSQAEPVIEQTDFPVNENFEEDDDMFKPDFELSRDEINESLLNFDISPLKSHAKSTNHITSEGKRKVAKINEKVKQLTHQIEKHVNIPLKEVHPYNDIEKKAKNFDEIMSLLKEKVFSSDKRTIVQLITLAPPSWTIAEVKQNFSVGEYQAKKARKLFQEKGVLSISPLYKGKSLAKEVEDSVKAFYDSNDLCRIMPGKKDYVSIGKNIHMQKKLLLCNLKELYIAYKELNTGYKISYSKFASLKPKWCILPGASGTHSVCVCTYHQNAKLFVDALNVKCTYKELMSKTVCSVERKECMLSQCDDCPGNEPLVEHIYELLGDYEEDFEVHYKQWLTTDRANLLNLTADVPTFVDLLVASLEKLRPHSYTARSQSEYLSQLKQDLDPSSIILLGDFAENYAFVVQDEIQSYHWNTQQCSLHPIVIYYKDNDILKHISYCYISDDIVHDVAFVYKIIQAIIPELKLEITDLKKVYFFTDGCAAQYKNFKSFYNLANINQEFNIDAEWNFFATSHGKSPCDGLGGTVKRMTAQESLKRPYRAQILTSDAMFKFCVEKIKGIKFRYIKQTDLQAQRIEHSNRYDGVVTLPGTRSFHQFIPLGGCKIGAKKCSSDINFTLVHNLKKETNEFQPELVTLGVYVAVVYEHSWWIGTVVEVNDVEQDVKIKFMHPKGPAAFFNWPQRDDHCFIANTNILKVVSVPQARSSSGRNYTLESVEIKDIEKQWNSYLESIDI